MSEKNSSSDSLLTDREGASFHSGDQDNLSLRLRHAIENKFPYPIASSYYQLRRINDWRGESAQIANVLGVSLEHLAVVAVAEYLSGEQRNQKLNAMLLETLCRPLSHGMWAGLLRDTMICLRDSGHKLFTSELLSLYFADPETAPGISLRVASDELVHLRNDILKRSAELLPTHERHRRFKQRLVGFLRDLLS